MDKNGKILYGEIPVRQYKLNLKRKRLIQNCKAIFYSFNGAKYDHQFIFKSKRLRFQELIDSFGIIFMKLEGGYIEFRDVMRMTGVSFIR